MRTLESLDVSGKRVLLRADLNVPMSAGRVTDAFRIEALRPTLDHLMDAGAKVIVVSHLGRPQGMDPAFTMRPVAEALRRQYRAGTVRFVADVAGPAAQDASKSVMPGHVMVLENVRYEPGEVANDPHFADALAALADVYVNDAFGSCHRAHASVVGVAERLPSAAGFLLADEVDTLSRLVNDPPRPFVVVLGGAKVADKLGVVHTLVEKADRVLIGGGMCFTFLKALGCEIGRSLVDEERLDDCKSIASRVGLPTDVLVAPSIDASNGEIVSVDHIPSDMIGVDIGPDTAAAFAAQIADARSVFWNGPMGIAENEAFARGTRIVGQAVVDCDGYSVTGGGDTAAIMAALGLGEVDFASTGGGASLEFLEGRSLPGIAALERSAGMEEM